jgi:hypothetical protein
VLIEESCDLLYTRQADQTVSPVGDTLRQARRNYLAFIQLAYRSGYCCAVMERSKKIIENHCRAYSL